MENEVVIAPTAESTNEAPVLSAEQIAWKQQMDYQFNTDAPTQQQPAFEQPANTENTDLNTEAAATQAYDYTPFIKETFGVESIEEAKSQWQQLQELKNTQQTPAEIKFENEFSKQLFDAINAGKTKEVRQYLEQQEKIETLTTSEVNNETADEIIKLGMQFENKDLTQQEIDFKFRKMFALPKEPVQTAVEDDDEFAARHSEWKDTVEDIKMSKTIEAKMMKPKLVAAKSAIQFPTIEQSADADYEAYKASKAYVSEVANNELIPAIKSLKESDVQLGFKVNDANNQMEFDIALAPTPEAFEKARQDSLSFDTWIQSVGYDESGKFHPERVQKLILLYNNYDNYVQSIARQAVNAERKMVISKETVNPNSGARNYNVNTERTELQRQMDARLS